MLCLGVEATAHTLGVGIFDETQILADARSVYKPEKGKGIHPLEAAQHHEHVRDDILACALHDAGLALSDIDVIAYAKGPGLPPCLRVGCTLAKELATKVSKPLIAVNHPVAHIEIGRFLTKCNDPVVLYVSGGNTQVISYANGRYRVFGETLDISVGNAIDVFIRRTTGESPGGPAMERLAAGGSYVELPYVVKGMDLSFSGILTAALKKHSDGTSLNGVCYSFQETCYAMLVEVTERALAHLNKSEVLVTGGVAASSRLNEMMAIMCEARGAIAHACPKEYSGDNGAMVAVTGLLAYTHGQQPEEPHAADFDARWRVDQADASWIDGVK